MPFPSSYPTHPPSSHIGSHLSAIVDIEKVLAAYAILDPSPTDPKLMDTEEHKENEELVEVRSIPWHHLPSVAGQYVPPPTVAKATSALVDLKLILRPPPNSGGRYKDPKLDLLL
jgi:hypothetical protein